ncbi:MAG: transposase, partial [Clostridiales bacterium]|nr:transposase [Clostridiales bacterium]
NHSVKIRNNKKLTHTQKTLGWVRFKRKSGSILLDIPQQIWFNLSDEGIEDSIYDSYAMRSFMHIDFNEQQVPDATTLLKFGHMLEANIIGEKILLMSTIASIKQVL